MQPIGSLLIILSVTAYIIWREAAYFILSLALKWKQQKPLRESGEINNKQDGNGC